MSTIAISGHLKDPLGNALAGANVTFRLTNFTSIPIATGTNIVVPIITTLTTDATGLFSGQIQGNDTITPANTLYQVNFTAGPLALYSFTGAGPINLDVYPPLAGATPPAVGPVPTNLLTSTNQFTGVNTFTQPVNLVGGFTSQSTATFAALTVTGAANLNAGGNRNRYQLESCTVERLI
jgi:hypothetical protein